MGKITALRAGRGKRVRVFLDGKFIFSLGAEIAAEEGLQLEQVLSEERIEALTRADRFHRYWNAALDYLNYRPRSESELRQRLRRRGFDGELEEAVISRLKERGLVDDTTFAQFWRENREAFSPRSQWLIKQELQRKGVDNNIIDEMTKDIDEEDSAYRAALKKARRLPRSSYEDFRRRLAQYLGRRGFSYEVIKHTVERLWQEPL